MPPIHDPPVIAAETAAPERRQIGSARMERDGTIVLQIRMMEASSVGDVEIRYAPGAAGYERIRSRLPSLAPGRLVPVYDDWD